MTDCTRLSDRIPEVALAGAGWTPEEAQHLRGCRSCQLEWELLRATGRLGSGLPAFDASAHTRALRQRLDRAAVNRRRRPWRLAGVAAAAAVAGVLWSGREPERPPPSEAAVARLQIPLPELEGLQPAELDSVLRMMDNPSSEPDPVEPADSGNLTGEELETVLDYWEG